MNKTIKYLVWMSLVLTLNLIFSCSGSNDNDEIIDDGIVTIEEGNFTKKDEEKNVIDEYGISLGKLKGDGNKMKVLYSIDFFNDYSLSSLSGDRIRYIKYNGNEIDKIYSVVNKEMMKVAQPFMMSNNSGFIWYETFGDYPIRYRYHTKNRYIQRFEEPFNGHPGNFARFIDLDESNRIVKIYKGNTDGSDVIYDSPTQIRINTPKPKSESFNGQLYDRLNVITLKFDPTLNYPHPEPIFQNLIEGFDKALLEKNVTEYEILDNGTRKILKNISIKYTYTPKAKPTKMTVEMYDNLNNYRFDRLVRNIYY